MDPKKNIIPVDTDLMLKHQILGLKQQILEKDRRTLELCMENLAYEREALLREIFAKYNVEPSDYVFETDSKGQGRLKSNEYSKAN